MEFILIDGYLPNSIPIGRSLPNSVSINKYLPDSVSTDGYVPIFIPIDCFFPKIVVLIEGTSLNCLHFCIMPEVKEQEWEAIQGIVLKKKRRSKGNQRFQI